MNSIFRSIPEDGISDADCLTGLDDLKAFIEECNIDFEIEEMR